MPLLGVTMKAVLGGGWEEEVEVRCEEAVLGIEVGKVSVRKEREQTQQTLDDRAGSFSVDCSPSKVKTAVHK